MTNHATNAAYHDNATCGCCGGKLETDRDAICHTCSPDDPGPFLVSTPKPQVNHVTNAAEATRAIMQGWLASNAKDPAMQAIIQTAIDAATAEATKERDAAYDQLRYLWQTTGSCPCGARIESPKTHPHVGGCPTAKALKQ